MVVAGFASGLVIQFIDPDFVSTYLGNDVSGILLAATLGILINVPLLFEIPLVALLLLLGMGVAPAAALLFTAAAGGPVTFWGLAGAMPKRAVATLAASTWVIGVVGGLGLLAYDLLGSGHVGGLAIDRVEAAIEPTSGEWRHPLHGSKPCGRDRLRAQQLPGRILRDRRRRGRPGLRQRRLPRRLHRELCGLQRAVPQPWRWHLHRYGRSRGRGRSRGQRKRRLRCGLRQRWRQRPVRHQLRPQQALQQQRRRDIRRRFRINSVGPRGGEEVHGMRVGRLRPGRPS